MVSPVITDTQCNGSGTQYHYVAWKATTSKIAVGSYTGVTSGDNRNIALASGFGTPDWVIIKTQTAVDAVQKMAVTGQATDTACYFRNIACAADAIQALQTDGFQVGTAYNTDAVVYYYIAFSHRSSATAAGLVSLTARREDSGAVDFGVDDRLGERQPGLQSLSRGQRPPHSHHADAGCRVWSRGQGGHAELYLARCGRAA